MGGIRLPKKYGSLHWINVIIVMALIVFGISFATSNMTPVQVALLHWKSESLPLYLPIFIAFFTGVVGGVLSLFFSRKKHKAAIEQLQKENTLLQQEVENLRNIPLQDDV